MQKLIPWHCPSISKLSTIYVAYKEVYDIDVIQKICLHADKGLDENLTPNESDFSLFSLHFHIIPVICIIVLNNYMYIRMKLPKLNVLDKNEKN